MTNFNTRYKGGLNNQAKVEELVEQLREDGPGFTFIPVSGNDAEEIGAFIYVQSFGNIAILLNLLQNNGLISVNEAFSQFLTNPGAADE